MRLIGIIPLDLASEGCNWCLLAAIPAVIVRVFEQQFEIKVGWRGTKVEMAKKLHIRAIDGWSRVYDPSIGGRIAMRWNDVKACGTLQISTGEYTGGAEPQFTQEELVKNAESIGRKDKRAQLVSTSSGKCVIGEFGSAIFTAKAETASESPPYLQIWFLSNGLDIVFATLMSTKQPCEQEIAEAGRIVMGLAFR